MIRFLSLLYIFAAGLSAAFLFSQTPTVTFVQGKVEYVVLDGDKGQKIDDLEVNSSVLPNHLIATGKGSRTELQQRNIIWRLGSLSVGKWLSQKRFWLNLEGLLEFLGSSEVSGLCSMLPEIPSKFLLNLDGLLEFLGNFNTMFHVEIYSAHRSKPPQEPVT